MRAGLPRCERAEGGIEGSVRRGKANGGQIEVTSGRDCRTAAGVEDEV